jgi:hypothetical protein
VATSFATMYHLSVCSAEPKCSADIVSISMELVLGALVGSFTHLISRVVTSSREISYRLERYQLHVVDDMT